VAIKWLIGGWRRDIPIGRKVVSLKVRNRVRFSFKFSWLLTTQRLGLMVLGLFGSVVITTNTIEIMSIKTDTLGRYTTFAICTLCVGFIVLATALFFWADACERDVLNHLNKGLPWFKDVSSDRDLRAIAKPQ